MGIIVSFLAYIVGTTGRILFFPLKIYGRENIPKQGGFIIASSHLSNLDPVIFGIMFYPRRLAYMAKQSLFKGILGWILIHLGVVPVKRDATDFGSIRKVLRQVKNGKPLVVFPEGTRRKGQKELHGQPGIGFLAAKSGVPVVPVFIKGSNKAMAPGTKWFKRHRVTIKIGKPLTIAKKDPFDLIAGNIVQHIDALKQSKKEEE